MNKYDVTLTAHYEKTVSVYADTPEQANCYMYGSPIQIRIIRKGRRPDEAD